MSDPRPPGMRNPETPAVGHLRDYELKVGDVVTVVLHHVPDRASAVGGRVVTATENVLVIDEGRSRHRTPWDSVATLSTTTEPEHPGL